MLENTYLRVTLLALPLCLVLTACGDKKPDDKAEKKTDDKAAEAKTDEKAAEPEPAAEPEKPEVKMIEFDLSAGDPEWAGWVAEGPEGAKVMADGVKGARIAADGHDAFDLAFAPKKTDLAELEANVQKGADASKGEMKLTFTSDTPELLEWVADGYGSKRYNFVMNMTVGDREVTCKNNYMMGIATEEDLAMHKAACATLKKKE